MEARQERGGRDRRRCWCDTDGIKTGGRAVGGGENATRRRRSDKHSRNMFEMHLNTEHVELLNRLCRQVTVVYKSP